MSKSHFNDEFLVLLGPIISRFFTCSNEEKKGACSSPISMRHDPGTVFTKLQWNSAFFAFSMILEGTTEKVLQFKMPLESIYNRNLVSLNKKCINWQTSFLPLKNKICRPFQSCPLYAYYNSIWLFTSGLHYKNMTIVNCGCHEWCL